MTEGACETRLENLEKKWIKFQEQHETILTLDTAENLEEQDYFKNDYLSITEEQYLTQKGTFIDKLKSYHQTPVPGISNNQGPNQNQGIPIEVRNRNHLPRIDIPKFSGDYHEWANFRDLFQSMVHEDRTLTDTERMHYLKNALTGEAALLLQNITPTGTNFGRAWDLLTEQYQNLRILVNVQIATLCKLKSMTKESVNELKALFNATNDAIGNLRTLERAVDQWDDWLVYITVQRLDPITRRDWENSLGADTHPPDFELLKIFLSTRIRTLESLANTSNASNANAQNSNHNNKSDKPKKSVKAHPVTNSSSKPERKPQQCPLCKHDHYIGTCTEFKSKSIPQRFEFTRSSKLCFNCLGTHMTKDCKSQKVCRTCFQRHHSLLHDPNKVKLSSTSPASQGNSDTSSHPELEIATSSVTGHIIDTSVTKHTPMLLGTAIVRISSKDGTSTLARALLDPCAECNFVSESLAQRLKLPKKSSNLTISGIGATPSENPKGLVEFTISPRQPNSTFKLQTTALVLTRLTEYLPTTCSLSNNWHQLCEVELADPNLNSGQPVELLLGCEAYATMLRPGLKTGTHTPIIAQQTALGWILTGSTKTTSNQSSETIIPTHGVVSLPCIIQNNLPQLLQRFWEQEEVAQPSKSFLTEEEQDCERIFCDTHSRTEEGRYMVRQPFKGNPESLGDSRLQALRTLKGMERRFEKNPSLFEAYKKFFEIYSDLKHMELSENADDDKICYYLPHHGIFKESSTSTKIRAVFNGSKLSSTGVSLNELLHIGEKLQTDMPEILLRWRKYRIVFSADIEKMFRQILIHPDDRDFQKILWRISPSDVPLTFKLTTVTYGLASSPFLANRVLKQLANDEANRFPKAAASLLHQIYVDDLFDGSDDIDSALELQKEYIDLLMAGGLPLRKWTANDLSLLKHLPPEWVETSQTLSWNSDEEHILLGLHWRPESDTFVFSSNMIDIPESNTKRSVLSSISKLYDPLGWLAPLTITYKIFMRTLWEKGIDWDTVLPSDLLSKWVEMYSLLKKVHIIEVPRWIETSNDQIFLEIHGFSDSSISAYSAAVYARVCNSNFEMTCKLICAKTKVAPVKQLSIPRLELCGAQLLVRLTNYVYEALRLSNVAVHLWSDSTNVLYWIQAQPSTWKTFVANRVSYIQTTLPNATWHHIEGVENPADCATRGLSPEQLKEHALWWFGPTRLTLSSEPWSTDKYSPEPTELLEQKIIVYQTTILEKRVEVWDLFFPCASSFSKLLRVTAWCRRWLLHLPRYRNAIFVDQDQIREILTPTEIDNARLFWISIVQKSAYHSEITKLSGPEHTLPKKSSLVSLNPFLDEKNMLRVGGRHKHSVLDHDEKHPLILPRKSPITDLVIDQCHKLVLHGGTQLTLATLRRQYWIPQGRQAVKARISNCVICIRYRTTSAVQQMANLPAHRVQPNRAFLNSGVDYFGPFPIRISSGRGRQSQKGFIAVFVCLSTRAVHLEAVSNYTTAQFLAAFRRFSGRRGIPLTLRSDCATNFVGADSELRKLFTSASKFSKVIAEALANDGVTLLFNPPSAPHQGGIWEAAVKSVKHHLKRVIGDSTLTFEELSTLLIQIEACLNSRPLQALSDDPNDLSALTPGHFLVGVPLTTVPEPSLLGDNINRSNRWTLIQKMYQDFWHRWSQEYLHSLQTLPKWQRSKPSVQVGDLAVLKNEILPPSKWSLCRVIDIHPGDNGLVRVVTVRTAASTYKRPITKLCLIPTHDNTYRPLVE